MASAEGQASDSEFSLKPSGLIASNGRGAVTQDTFARYFDSEPDMFPGRILNMVETGIQAAGFSCEIRTEITCGSTRIANILSHFIIYVKASKTSCLQRYHMSKFPSVLFQAFIGTVSLG